MQLVRPLRLFWLLHVHGVWWGELLLVCIWMSQYCGVLCNVMSCVTWVYTSLVCVYKHPMFCTFLQCRRQGGNNRGSLPWTPKQCWTRSNTHLFSSFRSKSTTYRALASSGMHSSRVRWNVYWSWGPSSISEKQKMQADLKSTIQWNEPLAFPVSLVFFCFFFVFFFAL